MKTNERGLRGSISDRRHFTDDFFFLIRKKLEPSKKKSCFLGDTYHCICFRYYYHKVAFATSTTSHKNDTYLLENGCYGLHHYSLCQPTWLHEETRFWVADMTCGLTLNPAPHTHLLNHADEDAGSILQPRVNTWYDMLGRMKQSDMSFSETLWNMYTRFTQPRHTSDGTGGHRVRWFLNETPHYLLNTHTIQALRRREGGQRHLMCVCWFL